MTEEEAKKKACHKTLSPIWTLFNKQTGMPMTSEMAPRPCLGSTCMAWRKIKVGYGLSSKDDGGYCGLVGEE